MNGKKGRNRTAINDLTNLSGKNTQKQRVCEHLNSQTLDFIAGAEGRT
jgi:hypothetical protein